MGHYRFAAAADVPLLLAPTLSLSLLSRLLGLTLMLLPLLVLSLPLTAVLPLTVVLDSGDCDLESEIFRWMGDLRFDIYPVWRMISLRTYGATLRYVPAGSEEWVTLEGDDWCGIWATNCTHMASDMHTTPDAGAAAAAAAAVEGAAAAVEGAATAAEGAGAATGDAAGSAVAAGAGADDAGFVLTDMHTIAAIDDGCLSLLMLKPPAGSGLGAVPRSQMLSMFLKVSCCSRW